MKKNLFALALSIQKDYRYLDQVKKDIKKKTIEKNVIQKDIDSKVDNLTKRMIVDKANKETKKSNKRYKKRKNAVGMPKRKYVGTYNTTTEKWE